MKLNRIRVSEQVDNYLRQMKGKTGLTPNLLCRIGFCLSLREPTYADPADYTDDGGREFNRFTLLGEWDSFFMALLKERCVQDGLDPVLDLESQFHAHLSRGVILLFQRMKNISDLSRLVEEAQGSYQEN